MEKSEGFLGWNEKECVSLLPEMIREISMAREDIVQKWLEQVGEDVSAAECLFHGGHWLYVAFLCH